MNPSATRTPLPAPLHEKRPQHGLNVSTAETVQKHSLIGTDLSDDFLMSRNSDSTWASPHPVSDHAVEVVQKVQRNDRMGAVPYIDRDPASPHRHSPQSTLQPQQRPQPLPPMPRPLSALPAHFTGMEDDAAPTSPLTTADLSADPARSQFSRKGNYSNSNSNINNNTSTTDGSTTASTYSAYSTPAYSKNSPPFAEPPMASAMHPSGLAVPTAMAPPSTTTPLDPPDASPPIVLHCSAALDTPFTPDERMARARTVLEASQRMPAVGFFGPPYGDRWYVDAVALLHNAVRRQLYDAFIIANALAKMSMDVAEADLVRMYAWLGSLDRFVTTAFDAEERYLFPLVDTALRRLGVIYPPDLVLINRTSTKHNILDLLSVARKTRDVAAHEVSPRVHALRYALDRFGEAILDYFSFTEGFIPRHLKTGLRHGQKDKDKLERHIFDHIFKQQHGATLAAMLIQCIENRQARAEFICRNIKREKERELFREHIRQVETKHMNLAVAFDKLAMKYEKEFGVQTFMDLYGSNVNSEETLRMLGDVDLNEE